MEEKNQNEEPGNSREQDETPKQYGTETSRQAESYGTGDNQYNDAYQQYYDSTGQQNSSYQQNNVNQQGSPYEQYGTDTSQQKNPYQQYGSGANQQNSQYQQQYGGTNQQSSQYQQQYGGTNQQSSQYQQYSQYQQNNPYQQYSDYQKAGQPSYSTGFGIASMILGILSLVLFCTCLNIPLAIAAVIFGVLQLCRGPQARGMAIAGIVTAVLSVFALFAMIALMWTPFMEYYQQELPDRQMPGYEYDYDYDDGMEDFFDFFDGRDHF